MEESPIKDGMFDLEIPVPDEDTNEEEKVDDSSIAELMRK